MSDGEADHLAPVVQPLGDVDTAIVVDGVHQPLLGIVIAGAAEGEEAEDLFGYELERFLRAQGFAEFIRPSDVVVDARAQCE